MLNLENRILMDRVMHSVQENLKIEGARVTGREVMRTNGPAHAFSIEAPGKKVAPVFYAEDIIRMADDGVSVQAIADSVIDRYHDAQTIAPELVTPTKEMVMENSFLAVCNTERNAGLLESVPHESIKGTDLSAYVRATYGNGSFRVTNEQMELLGINQEELLGAARLNMNQEGYTVKPLGQVLGDMLGSPSDMPSMMAGPEMAVITNRSGQFGAAAIAMPEVLDQARKMTDSEEIYILPSSIHELIAIRADSSSPEELHDMITEINASVVSSHEILSDEPYKYDGKSLSMAREEKIEKHRSR